jgi:Domain of unknown function (DUF4105)
VILRTLGRAALAVCLLGLGAWAALALRNAGADAGPLRSLLAIAMALLTLACAAALLLGRGTLHALAVFAVPLIAVLGWFATLEPRNDRIWTMDVARAPWAEIDGDLVTIHEVRHFAWRTEADFTEHWETRTVDLAKLEGVDLLGSYWMGDAIAHVMVSFAFEDVPALAISIETRKEEGEPYSTVLGFFRRYELVYVVGDERDLIGVRTNVRANPPEDVYLYRVDMPKEAARRLFLEYVRDMNELREHPQFYNTATTNCTTMVLINNRVNGPISLLNWKILLSGYLPQLVYERGRLEQSLAFPELRRRSRVNNAAQATGIEAPDFSARIREGIPRPRS